MRGKLITFEGGEGAGKSTVVTAAVDFLQRAGVTVITSREPGGTPLAERIRGLLLDPDLSDTPAMTELLLMFAARADHLHARITPALEAGHWVVLDRFTDATYAYQGGGRGIAAAHIAALETLVQGQLRPDLTLLLDLPPEQGLARSSTPKGTDRFETEGGAFFDRVRAVYLERARLEPARIRVIDATQDLPRVTAAVVACLQELL